MDITRCRKCGMPSDEGDDDPCPTLCKECLDKEVAILEAEFDYAVESGQIVEGEGVDFVIGKMRDIGYTEEALEETEIMIIQGTMLNSMGGNVTFH